MMVISPDEGGMGRAIYVANVLGLDMGMFYKRRDYSTVVNGKNPIVAHEFLGASVEGKDVIIVDDMISSGESMLDNEKELKRMKAYKSHILTKKSQKRKRNLRKSTVVDATNVKSMKKALPYL